MCMDNARDRIEHFPISNDEKNGFRRMIHRRRINYLNYGIYLDIWYGHRKYDNYKRIKKKL